MRRIYRSSLVLTAVAVVALCCLCPAQMTKDEEDQRLGMESHIGKLTGHAAAAQGTYRRYCVGCHGVLGDGEGENAQWIDPKPRNFTLGIFKCRSTTTGTLPLDSDLYDTIGRGLDSSNMPSWNPLSAQQRADLVAYVKHFSARWVDRKTGRTNSNSSGAGSHGGKNQSRPSRIPESGMLEVPWADGEGKWTFRRDPNRRSESAHSTL